MRHIPLVLVLTCQGSNRLKFENLKSRQMRGLIQDGLVVARGSVQVALMCRTLH